MEDFPLTLSAPTVGVIAMALPFVAVVIVQGVKGWFYWWKRIPVRWKASLPDRLVWPGLAGVVCIGGCLGLRLDVGTKLVGDEWPKWLPWWLSAIVSGVILAVLSSKVLYPLLVAPAAKLKAQTAVAAAIAAVAAVTPVPLVIPESVERELPLSIVPEVPQMPKDALVPQSECIYVARLLFDRSGLPTHLLLTAPNGEWGVLLLTDSDRETIIDLM
jgi:hypothetical protein